MDGGKLQLVRALHARERRKCELVVSTQCSIDRLGALHRLVTSFDDVVVVAILLEYRASEDCAHRSGNELLQMVSKLHASSGACFEALIFRRSERDSTNPYPINALRNASLQAAGKLAPLVWILDVDCVPCIGARDALIGSPERSALLHGLCCDDGAVVVVPCVELLRSDDFSNLPCSVDDVKQAMRSGSMRPFMEGRWPVGHQATDFDGWLSSDAAAPLIGGLLTFEPLFEPYLILAAALCPWFDEEMSGYGRNKAEHALHLHACGASFWRARDVALVHVSHSASLDRLFALGNPTTEPAIPPTQAGRLQLTLAKRRYDDLESWFALHADASLPPPAPPALHSPPTSQRGDGCSWASNTPRAARLAAASASKEMLTQLCSRWMVYRPPSVRVELLDCDRRVQLEAGEPVWLVTHLSFDRMDRLRAQLDSWAGPCAAAVWVGRDRRAIATVHAFARSLPPSRRVKIAVVSGDTRRWWNGTQPHSSLASLYPANSMRRAALEAVPPGALVLLLDVDARPPAALGLALGADCDSQPTGWKRELHRLVVQECRVRRRFLVLPALQLRQVLSPDLTDSQDRISSLLSPTDPLAALASLSTSELEAFHAHTAPDGHGRTNTEAWLAAVTSRSAVIADVVDVEHTCGYEPYGIVDSTILANVGSFDPRFVGWHRDRVELFNRLAASAAPLSGAHSAQGTSNLSGFSVLRSPVAFVLDWSPHLPTKQREASAADPFYVAAMEGLSLRSLRVLAGLRSSESSDFPTTDASEHARATDSCSTKALLHLAVQALIEYYGDALVLPLRGGSALPTVWTNDNNWCVIGSTGFSNVTWIPAQVVVAPAATAASSPGSMCASVAADYPSMAPASCCTTSSPLTEQERATLASKIARFGMSTSTEELTTVFLASGVGPPKSARANGLPVSGLAVRASPRALDAAGGGIAISFDVSFSDKFHWGGGGTLPGIFSNPTNSSGHGLEARFRWGESGRVRFNATIVAPSGKTWQTRREVQIKQRTLHLVPKRWHRFQAVVRTSDGFVAAWCDGVCIFLARTLGVSHVGGGASGLLLTVFRTANPPKAEDEIAFRNIQVHGVSGLRACAAAAAQIADANTHASLPLKAVDEIIKHEVTVIFAPKDWQSIGPRCLEHFLKSSPMPKRLIVALVEPLARETREAFYEVADYASKLGVDTVVLQEECEYRNAYDLRNELAAKFAVSTKYVLHLNTDVVGVDVTTAEHHWLRQLVQDGEQWPDAWALMPILLERNPNKPLHLHAWWRVVARVPSHNALCLPRLHASFDSAICAVPTAALPAMLSTRAPLFLEDHCILAKTARFPPDQPLFDPRLWFRREFFDLAWSIRARGGDVRMVSSSVVIYDRLRGGSYHMLAHPESSLFPGSDLPWFVARRHDDITWTSIVELNRKWQVMAASGDSWTRAERDDALTGLCIEPGDSLLLDPIWRVRLLVAFLVAAGFNRFCPLQCEGATEMVLDPLAALKDLPGRKVTSLRFWNEVELCEDEDGSQTGAPLSERDPLDGVLPWGIEANNSSLNSLQSLVRQGSQSLLIVLSAMLPSTRNHLDSLIAFVAGDDVFLWIRCREDTDDLERLKLLLCKMTCLLGGKWEITTSVDLSMPVSKLQYAPVRVDELEQTLLNLVGSISSEPLKIKSEYLSGMPLSLWNCISRAMRIAR